MTARFDITAAARAAWVRARAETHANVRRPEPDETMLSEDEIWHGIRCGAFAEAEEEGAALEACS